MTIIPTKTPAFKITFRRGVHFQQAAVIDVAACSQICISFIDKIRIFGFWILGHPLQTELSTFQGRAETDFCQLTEAFQQVLLPAKWKFSINKLEAVQL